MAHTIGCLNEKPLHAALKDWYRREGDAVEVPIEGFVVDLVRGDQLVEIQTRGFAALHRKLDTLVDSHRMHVVHPVAAKKWIVRLDADGREAARRRSPKRGIAADVCQELVSFPSLLSHPNFTLEIALIEEDEVRRPDTRKGWRRGGYVVEERRLVDVMETVEICSPTQLLRLLPEGLPEQFSTADVAVRLGRSRHVGQKVAYCLRLADAIEIVRRDKAGVHYRRKAATT